jgi:hypothetical protein
MEKLRKSQESGGRWRRGEDARPKSDGELKKVEHFGRQGALVNNKYKITRNKFLTLTTKTLLK